MENSTIAAIATPAGKGGIAIIRISGNTALSVLRKLFSHIGEMQARKMTLGCIIDNGIVLDLSLIHISEPTRPY